MKSGPGADRGVLPASEREAQTCDKEAENGVRHERPHKVRSRKKVITFNLPGELRLQDSEVLTNTFGKPLKPRRRIDLGSEDGFPQRILLYGEIAG